MSEAEIIPPPAAQSLSGAERAAIVLQELGEETAAAVLREMDEAALTRISAAMTSMKIISAHTRTEVMDLFAADMGLAGLTGDSLKFLNRILVSALGEAQARDILKRLVRLDRPSAFQLPANTDTRALAMQMAQERPQTIALLLAHIPQEMGADLLTFLPEHLATEALYRFSILDVVSPNAVMELQNMIEELMTSTAAGGRRVSNLGGAKQTAEILNHLRGGMSDTVLASIDQRDAATAEKIRENLFTFSDLGKLSDRSMRVLLREVSTDILGTALRSVDKALRDRFFDNISVRQREILNEELLGGPPMRRADVLAAQGEIVAIALRIAAEGRIAINATEEMV